MELKKILLAILIVWALVTTLSTFFLFYQFIGVSREVERLTGNLEELVNTLRELNESISRLRTQVILVNIVIDYGNGTVVWYNNTVLYRNSTALAALMAIARVEYERSKTGKTVIVSINGVQIKYTSLNEGYFWRLYVYEEGGWRRIKLDPDRYILSDEETIKWLYEYVKP